MSWTRLLGSTSIAGVLLLFGCGLRRQGSHSAAEFQGDWSLEKSVDVTPPRAWLMKVEAAHERFTVHSHWEDPRDGRYGLTLIGLATPELLIDTTGKKQAAQSGPFVMRYRSTWRKGELVTEWSTSEFMGSSFRGTWTESVSQDRSKLTLDIDASSSGGETSRATLIFRRI